MGKFLKSQDYKKLILSYFSLSLFLDFRYSRVLFCIYQKAKIQF